MEPEYCPYCGGHWTLVRDEDEEGVSTDSCKDHYIVYWKCTKCSQKFGLC